MSTRRVNSTATEAKRQLSICCETLCDKQVVQEYIKELESKIAYYENLLKENEKYGHN